MPQLETVLDSALLTARVFQACSEVPALNFLKPAALLAVMICETAKVNIPVFPFYLTALIIIHRMSPVMLKLLNNSASAQRISSTSL